MGRQEERKEWVWIKKRGRRGKYKEEREEVIEWKEKKKEKWRKKGDDERRRRRRRRIQRGSKGGRWLGQRLLFVFCLLLVSSVIGQINRLRRDINELKSILVQKEGVCVEWELHSHRTTDRQAGRRWEEEKRAVTRASRGGEEGEGDPEQLTPPFLPLCYLLSVLQSTHLSMVQDKHTHQWHTIACSLSFSLLFFFLSHPSSFVLPARWTKKNKKK